LLRAAEASYHSQWLGPLSAWKGNIMHVGVAMFCTDYAMAPTELARALEDRGFESLWLPEHSHIPLTRLSPYPQGGELPKKYYDVMDPFVVLGAAAAVTTRIKIATGICLVAQRDPIQTAKAVATLDQLSGGRFLFGVGAGWNADEMADHGTDFKSRNKVMRERIEAMRVIWTQTRPEFHGEFVKFGPMMSWPKPVQKPHPPILVGGGMPWGARRALAYGDGWIPHARRPAYRLLDKLQEYRDLEKEAGRVLAITAFGAEHDWAAWPAYRDAGMERIVLSIDSEASDVILPKLDQWAARLCEVR
jgi:probable F420-dependent oxidoreductase